MNDNLLEIVSGWNVDQLDEYIVKLEERIENTRTLIYELKRLRRNKSRRKNLENGPRGGM